MRIKATYKMPAYPLILILGVIAILAGCATTKAELLAHKENHRSWRVDAPIVEVFKTYRNYAQVEFSNALIFGTGLQIDGNFFGETADLSVTQLTGFPLKRSFSLYFELHKSEDTTVVNAWAVDEGWLERLNAFKTLLPSISD